MPYLFLLAEKMGFTPQFCHWQNALRRNLVVAIMPGLQTMGVHCLSQAFTNYYHLLGLRFQPVRIPLHHTQNKNPTDLCQSDFRGGGRGIRTPVGLHPNGFQDRLVMTTSIALHVETLPLPRFLACQL